MKNFMSRIRKRLKRLERDESGQSMTEYILILLVVVMMVKQFSGTFKGLVRTQVEKLSGEINSADFD